MKSFALTYATSLFSLAEDENLTSKIYEELVGILPVFKENPDYSVLLDSPTVPVSQRLELIDEAFTGLSEYVVNFIKILCEKKCVHLFSDCVKEFEKIYNRKNNIEKVTVITATPLTSELQEKLISKLEKDRGKKVTLELRVDKAILGGIILRTENSQTDASVRARLDKIRTQIASQ